MAIKRFEDIEAWQMARELCHAIHKVISGGELSRSYALRDQMDRSSGSAMDNIAEGFDGGSDQEFIRFLGYAQRSCSEVKSQLYRAMDRDFITRKEFDALYEMAGKTHSMTGGFIRYLKNKRTNHQAQTTKHKPRSTKHQALSTKHQALSTRPNAL